MREFDPCCAMISDYCTCDNCRDDKPQHKSQEDIMREHDVCTKARTCVGGYKHDGYCYNKHGFVLGATIG